MNLLLPEHRWDNLKLLEFDYQALTEVRIYWYAACFLLLVVAFPLFLFGDASGGLWSSSGDVAE